MGKIGGKDFSRGVVATTELQSLQRIQSAFTGTPTLIEAIKANVRHGVETIKKSPSLAPLIKTGQLQVVGGYYNLNTGKVEILS